jgi:hypothetical protein
MADILDLERRVAALEAEAHGQQRLNTRTYELLAELRDDVAVLRRHAVATGGKVDELDARISHVDTQISELRRELPSMMADVMREVLKETKG